MNNHDIKLYLLNENNIYITRDFIEKTLINYGLKHRVQDMQTFQRSFIHNTYLINDPLLYKGNRIGQVFEKVKCPIQDIKKVIPLQKKCYEQLEFIGDAIIHNILAIYLYKRYPTQREGFLTRLRAKLEKKETLASYSKILGFDKYVMISKYMEVTDGRNSIHVLEDVFESFIGALSLEVSFSDCYMFIINFIEKEVDIAEMIRDNNNYKDTLLKYHHKECWQDPKYILKQEIKIEEQKIYYVVYVTGKDDKEYGVGEGTSKKKAEQDAAHDALIQYKVLDKHDNIIPSIPKVGKKINKPIITKKT